MAFLDLILEATKGITFAILYLLEVKERGYSGTWMPEHGWPSPTHTFLSLSLLTPSLLPSSTYCVSTRAQELH